MDRIPSSLEDLLPEAFDEYDERHVSHIAPNGLASEILGLLLLRREWDYLNLHQRSEQAESLMNSLYKACRDKWREDQ
jgi:hypothetical protein